MPNLLTASPGQNRLCPHSERNPGRFYKITLHLPGFPGFSGQIVSENKKTARLQQAFVKNSLSVPEVC